MRRGRPETPPGIRLYLGVPGRAGSGSVLDPRSRVDGPRAPGSALHDADDRADEHGRGQQRVQRARSAFTQAGLHSDRDTSHRPVAPDGVDVVDWVRERGLGLLQEVHERAVGQQQPEGRLAGAVQSPGAQRQRHLPEYARTSRVRDRYTGPAHGARFRRLGGAAVALEDVRRRARLAAEGGLRPRGRLPGRRPAPRAESRGDGRGAGRPSSADAADESHLLRIEDPGSLRVLARSRRGFDRGGGRGHLRSARPGEGLGEGRIPRLQAVQPGPPAVPRTDQQRGSVLRRVRRDQALGTGPA